MIPTPTPPLPPLFVMFGAFDADDAVDRPLTVVVLLLLPLPFADGDEPHENPLAAVVAPLLVVVPVVVVAVVGVLSPKVALLVGS